MSAALIDNSDPLDRQNGKLLKIIEVLMRRVEQVTDDGGAAYAHFERAVILEDQISERTRDLEHALDLLNDSNAQLAQAIREAERARSDLANAIETIQEGFALFDSDGRLVLHNSRFGMYMPDLVAELRPGLEFADYVRHASQSRFLELPDMQSRGDWAARRMQLHQEKHVMFNLNLTGDCWVQVSEHRTRDGQTVILQTDITDIIRLERRERGKLLDDQAQLIRATLEHIDQGVCIFDRSGQLRGWNQNAGSMLSIPISRFRVGIEFDVILRRIGSDFEIEGGLSAHDIAVWVGAQDRRAPLRFYMRSGTHKTLDVFARQMPDRGFVISFSDVTAERAAARALAHANERLEQRVRDRTLELEDALAKAERANASKSRFVAAASHDLRQPLSAARLYLASLQEELASADHRVLMDKAQRALTSVEDIIDALLDISRLESGHVEVDVTHVPLRRITDQLIDEFAPIAAIKGLDLRYVPCGAMVESDASYLRRVLQNLIANAIRYTPSGKVLVGARRQGRNLRLEVRDTGPGIAPADQDRIFQEFHRLDAHVSAAEGMGLGLAIVDRACALLGHPLELRSDLGCGACFSVTVPLVSVARSGPEIRGVGGARARASLEGRIVLLIENDPDLRHALTLLLRGWGADVVEAGNLLEALTQLADLGLSPDAMLVDYELDEGVRGPEVIARIIARHGVIPARIITGHLVAEMHAHCRAAGLEVLPKPIDPAELEAFLKAAVG
ncbi:Signal transduction histidine kinase [Roseovarius sp. EC-HK134]|uniref:hybrid sensor histidine kinase/response regulator n=1 Tax=Roseovarius TaxID=74030 RepID=UPI0012537CD1|nr:MULTISPECIES: PAS-domain containing protein [unclassified Roseovarius]VVT16746.1 Signal transduction histidine kinase [Roseovarius sp. EC-HK134]VVT17212.1 Signal transduction histidine kinase [Roseovarius sp. EC-SD190]